MQLLISKIPKSYIIQIPTAAAMDIDIFQNVDDYMNASNNEDSFTMPPPSSSTALKANHLATPSSSDAGTPEAPSKRQSKRAATKRKTTSKAAAASAILDLDLEDDWDTSGGESSSFTAGRGQKTAVKRFSKIKESLQRTVRYGDMRQAELEAQSAMRARFEAKRAALVQKQQADGGGDGGGGAVVVDSIDLSDDDGSAGAGSGASGSSNLHNQSVDDPFEEENYTVQVKVKWQGGPIERVPLRRYQPLGELCGLLAERYGGMPAAEVLLMMNERIVRHEETLDSIDYTIGKFLSARHIKPDVLRNISGANTNAKSSKQPSSGLSSTAIELKIQSSLWKRPLMLKMEPSKKMMVLVILCAQQLKCAPGKLRLRFDGEALDLNATAEELDLEGGEVMDLWMEE